jgi:ABC-type nitrate/sulfonate/bicarbonate transport system permease component
MSTAAGVAQIDRRWVQLAEILAATRSEMLWHVHVPGIAAHVLTGVRLAIGIVWIVLLPAEMLGVSSGFGSEGCDACATTMGNFRTPGRQAARRGEPTLAHYTSVRCSSRYRSAE